MNPIKNDECNTSDRELVAVRFFDAPRDLVWKVWTEPKHIAHWWGPKGSVTDVYDDIAYQHMGGMETGWSQSLDRLQEMVQAAAIRICCRRQNQLRRNLRRQSWTLRC